MTADRLVGCPFLLLWLFFFSVCAQAEFLLTVFAKLMICFSSFPPMIHLDIRHGYLGVLKFGRLNS